MDVFHYRELLGIGLWNTLRRWGIVLPYHLLSEQFVLHALLMYGPMHLLHHLQELVDQVIVVDATDIGGKAIVSLSIWVRQRGCEMTRVSK